MVVNCWDGGTENVTLWSGNPAAAVHAGLLGVRGMGARQRRSGGQAAAMRDARREGDPALPRRARFEP